MYQATTEISIYKNHNVSEPIKSNNGRSHDPRIENGKSKWMRNQKWFLRIDSTSMRRMENDGKMGKKVRKLYNV